MSSDEELGKGLTTLNVIWFAMLVSLGIYLFVGLQVAKNLEATIDPGMFTVVKYALYTLAFITLMMTKFVRKLILSVRGGYNPGAQNREYPVQVLAVPKYTIAMIVTWAMLESIGIFGLVLFFLGKNTTDLYLFIFVSAAAIVRYRPRKDELLSLSQNNSETTIGGVE